MWQRLTPASMRNEPLQQDILAQLRDIQQKQELSDDIATALIRHRIVAHQTAKAKPSPQSDSSLYQKLSSIGTEFNRQARLAIAGFATQAQTFHAQILSRPSVSKHGWIVLGVVGVGAISLVVSVASQTTQKSIKAEAAFTPLKVQPLDQKVYSVLIEGVLNDHFKQMDQQYLKAFDAKAINQLRLDTRRIAPASLRDDLINQKIEAKVKSHRDEWNQNEKSLAQANQLLNQGTFAGLTAAENELKKIKLLGNSVKDKTPYWNAKIKPVKNAIAKMEYALNNPVRPSSEQIADQGSGNSDSQSYSQNWPTPSHSSSPSSPQPPSSSPSKPARLPPTEWTNR